MLVEKRREEGYSSWCGSPSTVSVAREERREERRGDVAILSEGWRLCVCVGVCVSVSVSVYVLREREMGKVLTVVSVCWSVCVCICVSSCVARG